MRGRALLDLCFALQYDQVRILAEENRRNNLPMQIDWFARNASNNNAFNLAARLDDTFAGMAAMELLLGLGAGVTINEYDCDGLTALHRFVMLNNISSVKFILQQDGVEVDK